jgi:hypothetical protein
VDSFAQHKKVFTTNFFLKGAGMVKKAIRCSGIILGECIGRPFYFAGLGFFLIAIYVSKPFVAWLIVSGICLYAVDMILFSNRSFKKLRQDAEIMHAEYMAEVKKYAAELKKGN